MTVSSSQSIGGIHEAWHVVGAQLEHALEHVGHLLLAGRAIARDGHFDFQRSIFVDGNVAADGCGYGHALRPPNLSID